MAGTKAHNLPTSAIERDEGLQICIWVWRVIRYLKNGDENVVRKAVKGVLEDKWKGEVVSVVDTTDAVGMRRGVLWERAVRGWSGETDGLFIEVGKVNNSVSWTTLTLLNLFLRRRC
jgi:uncharacterized protein YunC (DUF1805 family)